MANSFINEGCPFVFDSCILTNTGYTNELGEAFRHMVPIKLIHLSYLIASSYVVSHAISQGLKANKTHSLTLEKAPAHHYHHPVPTAIHNATDKHNSRINRQAPSAIAVLDTLVWQGLASVILPGLAINRLCAVSRIMLNWRARKLCSDRVRKWIVTSVGISAIPVIIHPIDK